MASGGSSIVVSEHVDFQRPQEDDPPWLKAAFEDLGTKEWIFKGRRKVSNPLVERWALESAGAKIDATLDPWCAYYAGAKLEETGWTCSKSGMARSYLKWGERVEREDWRRGDVVVNWRGKRDDGVTGHVFFALDVDSSRRVITGIGGNQSDAVTIQEFPFEKLLGIRRPRGFWQSRTVRSVAVGTGSEIARPVANLLPEPTEVQKVADELASPLELLARAKPWLLVILSGITIAAFLYAAWYRRQDQKSGRNT